MNVLIYILTVVLVLTCLFLVLVVLMQRAKSDAGMGSAMGGSSMESTFGAETGNVLSTEGLIHTLKDIVPLAITMREQIESMREWARTRARMASARNRAFAKKEGWMARYGAPTANLGDKAVESSDDGERKLEL